ncbi:MAG: DUF2461 domain-containing protein [Bacteroidia bacterium]|nr:DUF2461 domain-containing protein [Bacteroidia bacterium]MBT8229348.1 DUF2461 domain-containing protein [Bacteroidia bacterium]
MSQIEKPTIQFLKNLSKNNNREWFNTNKEKWLTAQQNLKEFLADLEKEMNKSDDIEKTKLFRIYRDVRFSKDKTPYNQHYSMSMNRAGAFRRGGYYLRIEPKTTHIACGFWRPESKDLKLIRDHIASDSKPLRKIFKSKRFINMFGEIEGEQLKNTPRGYDKEHEASDLLRYKQFIAVRKLDTKQLTEAGFMKELVKTFKAVRPWFDYMTDILTHDLDGVPLYTE